ncbi:MAG TPA: isoprenylcysteine carboxylmethyltransferase family protein, partial [Nitrospirae bacterium]|nr:isoprenylcysteine carboxylmethyltransferase family protein [Nitrospirota bacterium]
LTPLFNTWVMISGILLVVLGYAGTLWCYSALGGSWRIGVNKNERAVLIKKGPYGFIRHPIYVFQIIMLAGVACLLPTLFSFMVLLIHFACVMIKAKDEEAYLLVSCGPEYKDYCARTGRFLPK